MIESFLNDSYLKQSLDCAVEFLKYVHAWVPFSQVEYCLKIEMWMFKLLP